MKPFLIAGVVACAVAPSLCPQTAAKSDTRDAWQPIDQLCGQLELVAPIEKNVVIAGKEQKRSYIRHVERAKLSLYPVVSEDEKCCAAAPLAEGKSGRYGAFAIEGVRKGSYWLKVATSDAHYIVPLRVTKDFSSQSCHDSSVGRSVVLDSNPPKVEIRIR